jgi:hypothetical protein
MLISIIHSDHCRWTGDARRPIKAEHLTLLLLTYLNNASDTLSTIEYVILQVLPEFVSAGSTVQEHDDDGNDNVSVGVCTPSRLQVNHTCRTLPW